MEESVARMQSSLKNLQWLIVASVALVMFICLSMMLLTMWNTYRLGQQSRELRAVAVETRDSLCAFKFNLQTTQRDAKDFLVENPDGIPGISAATIEQGIANRQNTLDSLQTLSCDGEVIN